MARMLAQRAWTAAAGYARFSGTIFPHPGTPSPEA